GMLGQKGASRAQQQPQQQQPQNPVEQIMSILDWALKAMGLSILKTPFRASGERTSPASGNRDSAAWLGRISMRRRLRSQDLSSAGMRANRQIRRRTRGAWKTAEL